MAPKERSDITYFGAGPALLPTDVLETAAKALLNYNGTGLGLAEHSHRAKHATAIINDVKDNLRTYLDIPDDYEILFMQGGGSGQFSATACNLVGSWVLRKQKQILGDREKLSENELKQLRKTVDSDLKLDYLVTGGWSAKASQEAARLLGKEHVNVVTGSAEKGYKFGDIADESTWKLSKDAAMVYYCDNETVDGVEFPGFPKSLAPGANGEGPIVVADMSSNILSRKIPIKNFSAIFFGAQKNLGLTGVTVVVVKKSLLPQPSADLMRSLGLPLPPIVLQYATIASNNSLYNTLSIFDVFIAGQVLQKLLATYPDKVSGQEAVSKKKADLIYGAVDANPEAYRVVPSKGVRSRMNICFRVLKGGDVDASQDAFVAEAEKQGMTGLKGHRSVGGIRASNYNSISLEGAQKLAKFIEEYAKA